MAQIGNYTKITKSKQLTQEKIHITRIEQKRFAVIKELMRTAVNLTNKETINSWK